MKKNFRGRFDDKKQKILSRGLAPSIWNKIIANSNFINAINYPGINAISPSVYANINRYKLFDNSFLLSISEMILKYDMIKRELAFLNNQNTLNNLFSPGFQHIINSQIKLQNLFSQARGLNLQRNLAESP